MYTHTHIRNCQRQDTYVVTIEAPLAHAFDIWSQAVGAIEEDCKYIFLI